MVERKLFKTKLCVLYQRGRCPRQNCSFAHGNAELRRFTSSYNGKRDYRGGGDLRDTLDKRPSPQRRHSPVRDARVRPTFHDSSRSRSLERNSDRKRRKKQLDVESDFSGSLKISDREEDQAKERKSASSENLAQLKEVLSNIDILERRKSEIQILVEQTHEEAESLTSRINELEAQLSKVIEESKRTSSEIKKFVKTYKQYVRTEDELKRLRTRILKLGDRFTSGSAAADGNGEDSSINDVEKTNNQAASPVNEAQPNSGQSKKVLHAKSNVAADLADYGGNRAESMRLGKFPQLNEHPTQSNIYKEAEMVGNRNDGQSYVGNGSKRKRGKSLSESIPSADKLKSSTAVIPVLSTSMAAHARDELVDIEAENIEVVEPINTRNNKGAAPHVHRRLPFPLLPPPPIRQNAYSQYKGGDEEEMLDVDIV